MPNISVPSGDWVRSTTVWLPATSIAPGAAAPSSIRAAIRLAIELPSTEASHQPAMLAATSSAVKSSPLFHFTPRRTFSVYSVASSLADQLSSSTPASVPSRRTSTRYSVMPRVSLASSGQS
jgi:hypothetical protein